MSVSWVRLDIPSSVGALKFLHASFSKVTFYTHRKKDMRYSVWRYTMWRDGSIEKCSQIVDWQIYLEWSVRWDQIWLDTAPLLKLSWNARIELKSDLVSSLTQIIVASCKMSIRFLLIAESVNFNIFGSSKNRKQHQFESKWRIWVRKWMLQREICAGWTKSQVIRTANRKTFNYAGERVKLQRNCQYTELLPQKIILGFMHVSNLFQFHVKALHYTTHP